MSRRYFSGCTLACAVLLAACMDASGPQPSFPDKLVGVTSANLTGEPGFSVDPITVRVIDTQSHGVAGQVVNFTVLTGGGSITPASVTTDSAGNATATWTLGPEPGTNTARAEAPGLGAVTFSAVANESPGVVITAVSGGSDLVMPGGCALPDPVVVKVTDAAGHPVANATVEFDADKNGAVSPATATTDADGLARTTWTLGLDGGDNTLHAVLRTSARPTVTFTGESVPKAPNGFATIGNRIYNPQCREHLFHGMARPALQWNAGGDDEWVNIDKDLSIISDWKANVVRIALSQTYWLSTHKQYDPTYKARVIDVVNKARDHGMAIILDLHVSDRDNVNYDQDPDVQQLPDRNSIAFWKEVAATFKDQGDVIFELYNEPHDISWEMWRNGGYVETGPAWPGGPVREGFQGVGMQQLYDAVRSTGAKNLVIVSGMHWGYFLDEIGTYALDGYNIVYGTHPYDWPDKQPDTWTDAWGSAAAQVPVIITEFGAYDCAHLWYYQSVMDYADAHGLSWVAWAYWTPPAVAADYPAAQREEDICKFPALIRDWNGTPSASGQLVKQRLATYPVY